MSDFTVADVLAWARTKPAGERYDYTDSRNCALCHFLRDTGRSASPRVSPYINPNDSSAGWRHQDERASDRRPYPFALEEALVGDDMGECTFGELAARLERLCPETPVSQTGWAAIDAYLTDIELASA